MAVFASFIPCCSLSLTGLFLSPSNPDGVAAFHAFLKTEFSQENLEFWLACEEFKKIRSATKLASRAHRIFEEFICSEAPKEVRAQICPKILRTLPAPSPLRLGGLRATLGCHYPQTH